MSELEKIIAVHGIISLIMPANRGHAACLREARSLLESVIANMSSTTTIPTSEQALTDRDLIRYLDNLPTAALVLSHNDVWESLNELSASSSRWKNYFNNLPLNHIILWHSEYGKFEICTNKHGYILVKNTRTGFYVSGRFSPHPVDVPPQYTNRAQEQAYKYLAFAARTPSVTPNDNHLAGILHEYVYLNGLHSNEGIKSFLDTLYDFHAGWRQYFACLPDNYMIIWTTPTPAKTITVKRTETGGKTFTVADDEITTNANLKPRCANINLRMDNAFATIKRLEDIVGNCQNNLVNNNRDIDCAERNINIVFEKLDMLGVNLTELRNQVGELTVKVESEQAAPHLYSETPQIGILNVGHITKLLELLHDIPKTDLTGDEVQDVINYVEDTLLPASQHVSSIFPDTSPVGESDKTNGLEKLTQPSYGTGGICRANTA